MKFIIFKLRDQHFTNLKINLNFESLISKNPKIDK